MYVAKYIDIHDPTNCTTVVDDKMILHYLSSPVPRPLSFLTSVCIHNNTQERKTSEKLGRPGAIHYVSGCEVDVGGKGGRGRYTEYVTY